MPKSRGIQGGLTRGRLFDTNIKATQIDEDIFSDQELLSSIAGDDLVLVLDVSETPDKVKYITKSNFVTGITSVTVTDNESTNENNLLTFVADAATSTGSHGLEMDGDLTYNPSTGNLSATQLTGALQTASHPNVTTLAGVTAMGSVSNALTLTYSDATLFHDANNADTSFTMGTSATEALKIEVLNGGSNKTAESIAFTSTTASGTGDHGKFTFSVDEATAMFTIDDGGVSIAESGAYEINGTAILSDSSGTLTLQNVDAIDATTESTIEAALDTLSNLASATALTTIGSAGATTNFAAGDVTFFNPVNNGNPTLSLGSDSNERLKITSTYDSGAQTLDKVTFETAAASSSSDKGKYVFNVDGTDIFDIDDSGINLTSGKSVRVAGTAVVGGVNEFAAGAVADGDSFIFADANDSNATKKDAIADLATLFAGTGLTASSSVISVDAAQSGITSLGTLTGLTLDGDKNVTPGDGAMIHLDTSTITDNNTSGSGTAALYTHVRFEAPTLAASNSSVTTTTASTVYISGAPSAGTNQTVSNGLALFVDAGNVRFDGNIIMGTNTSGNLLIADGSNFSSTAVGDLSEISTVASDDVLLAVDTSGGGLKKITRSTLVAGLATGSEISNVVEDSTPQLGGDLDVNGNGLVSTSNGNIALTPNGSGVIRIDGSNGVDIESGAISIKNSGAESYVRFYCEVSNAHYTQLQASPHSAYSGNVTVVLPAAATNLVGDDTTQTLTNKTFGDDVDIFEDANNADVTLRMGTSATESLAISVLNGGSNKTAESVTFTTATASSTSNHGKFTFNVDGTDIFDVDDSGINLASGKTFRINGTAIDGDITSVVAGTGLSGGGTDGDVTLNVEASQAITALTGGDLTIFEDANNADVSLKLGTSATESLSIEVLNGGSNKTAEEIHFSTATASGTADHGKMVFDVDGTDILTIDDDGLEVTGGITLSSVSNAGSDVDKFLVLDGSGNVDFRTGAEVLSDIGAGTGGGDMSNWVLEDGDGTEVTITNAKEVKFVEGGGLDIDWTDTDNGTDADPYDLTFTINAAQTGITSLLATDIKIGEDDETKIDFETADEIHFYANNTEQVYLGDNIFGPQSDSDVDLGATGVRWKDAYIDSVTVTGDVSVGDDLTLGSDSAIINMGADNDATLTHDGTTGLTIAANPITLDSGADIVFDAAGNDFNFKADGTEVLRITNSSSDVIIRPVVDAKDLIFQQRDGTEVARVEDNGTFNIVTDKLAINATAVTATAAELNLLDGGTSVGGSITLADSDCFVVNDGGTMKTIPASDIKTYAAGSAATKGFAVAMAIAL